MISRDNKLLNNLLAIKKELSNDDDENIVEKGLDIKLNRTSQKYEEAVIKNCQYIISRNSFKAMMAIDRYEKKKEKNDEEEDNYGFIETY